MLLRQQFVVQLAITEVQWNQRLLVLRAILAGKRQTQHRWFCRKKSISPGPSVKTAAPAKQMGITGAFRR
jgi:hypothetical protein